MARATWRKREAHELRAAESRIFCTDGRVMPTNRAMIAIATNSSTRLAARRCILAAPLKTRVSYPPMVQIHQSVSTMSMVNAVASLLLGAEIVHTGKQVAAVLVVPTRFAPLCVH